MMKMLRDTNNSRWIVLVTICMAVFVLAWIEQSSMIFSWDVSWLSEASRRLLAGGNYTNDFFENNPPLILYLYTPAVLMSKWLNLNIMFSIRLYVYAIASISLYLCYSLSRSIFSDSDKEYYLIMQVTCILLCIYVLLPFYENAQREHLFVMLTMPYYFLIAVRLGNKPVNHYICGIIGVCAGLGMFIKPVFILTPALLELYYTVRKRNILACVRIETVTIILVLVLYIAVMLQRHMDYINVVLPYVTRWCYANISLPWEARILNVYLFWPVSVVLLSIALIKQDPHKDFLTVLIIAAIGSIVIFILQGSNWYYRMLPMISFCILLISYLVLTQIADIKTRWTYSAIGFILFLTAMQLYYNDFPTWATCVLHPLSYITYGICLVTLFNMALPNDKHTLLKSSLTLYIIVLVMSEISKTAWANNELYFVSIVMLVLFAFFIKYHQDNKIQYTVSLFFILVFCMPLYQTLSAVYNMGNANKVAIVNLAHYLDVNAANKSIYLLSTDLRYLSALNYSHKTSLVSRFSHLLGLGGMATNTHSAGNDKVFLTKMIVDDLTKNKPDFVLVDIRQYKRSISQYQMINHHNTIHYLPFDHIAYFSEDTSFKKIWQSYCYKETIDSMQLAVYQRSQHC